MELLDNNIKWEDEQIRDNIGYKGNGRFSENTNGVILRSSETH